MLQAVFASASIAAPTGNPFCSKVALAATKVTGTLSDSFVWRGRTLTEMSDSAKLPLPARPGPDRTSDESASASSLIDRISVNFVSNVIVQTSFAGFGPLTSHE